METPLTVSFVAGSEGAWRMDRVQACRGESLTTASRLGVLEGPPSGTGADADWTLTGFTGELRYTFATERRTLAAIQAPLGRREATCAALIPIRKNATWWNLAQDERRAIFEERSRHIAIGRDHLPAVARRLHHCRRLGGPFDFITWFEYAREAEPAFDAMLARLRASEEWCYVEREVDIRLTRDAE